MTYASGIDGFGNLSQLLLISSSVFASNKNLNREPSALELLQVLR